MAPAASFGTKLKVYLKTAIIRLRLKQAQRKAHAPQPRREIADLLEAGKAELARIRIEPVILDDQQTEVLEFLELYCELLVARISSMDQAAAASGTVEAVEAGLEEAVWGILYAGVDTEVKELDHVRALLITRYAGKTNKDEFTKLAASGVHASDRLKRKMDRRPPSAELVEDYLRAIAEHHKVPFGDDDEDAAETDAKLAKLDGDGDDDDSGSDVGRGAKEAPVLAEGMGAVSPPRDLSGRSPLSIAPPSPSTERPAPKVKDAEGAEIRQSPRAAASKKGTAAAKGTAGSGPAKAKASPSANGTKKPDGEIPNVDDLVARFNLLKK